MRLTLRAALWIAPLSLAAAACSSSPDPRPPTTATVGVLASGCSLVADFGTGVAVAPGLIATSAHTIAGASAVVVVDHSGLEHPAEVVGFNPLQDVAILKISTSTPHASLGSVSDGDSGLLGTWHPDHGFDTTEVVVTRLLRVTIEDIYVEDLAERLAFEIEAEIVKGNSGGPVFTSDGEVAGIVYATSRERDGIGFVLRSEEIAATLDRVDGRPVANGRCF